MIVKITQKRRVCCNMGVIPEKQSLIFVTGGWLLVTGYVSALNHEKSCGYFEPKVLNKDHPATKKVPQLRNLFLGG